MPTSPAPDLADEAAGINSVLLRRVFADSRGRAAGTPGPPRYEPAAAVPPDFRVRFDELHVRLTQLQELLLHIRRGVA